MIVQKFHSINTNLPHLELNIKGDFNLLSFVIYVSVNTSAKILVYYRMLYCLPKLQFQNCNSISKTTEQFKIEKPKIDPSIVRLQKSKKVEKSVKLLLLGKIIRGMKAYSPNFPANIRLDEDVLKTS